MFIVIDLILKFREPLLFINKFPKIYSTNIFKSINLSKLFINVEKTIPK